MNQYDTFIQTNTTDYNAIRKSALPIDHFSDLPLGIIVCQPVRNECKSIQNLLVTYCNPFACSLFDGTYAGQEPLHLTDIPFLLPLVKSACHVLETGVSYTTESYEQQKGNWIASSIHRQADTCTIYLQRLSPRKNYQRSATYRQELEGIISDVSAQLNNLPPNKLDSCLIDSLSRIGRHTRADRAYIFVYSPDGLTNSCTHEWCAEHIEPQQVSFQEQENSKYVWWHQKMVHQEIILLSSLDDLPASAAAEKESLKNQSIQSLLVVPMVLDSRLVGFVGFDMVRQPHNWSETDIDLLKIYSGLVVSATSRAADEQQLIQANKRLKGLNRLSKALLNSQLLDEPADMTALKYIHAMIPCEVGIVFRIDQTGQFAYADNQVRWGKQESWPGIRFSADYLRNRKFSKGKTLLVNQLSPEANSLPAELYPYHWGHRSFLGVPLFAHQHYVGLLVLLDKSPHFFTKEHVLIAQEVAGQLSILLLQEEATYQLAAQANQLTESNQLLQAVVDNIPVGLGLWRPIRQEGRIVDFAYLLANVECETLTGLCQRETVQHSISRLFPPVRQSELFDKLIQVAETGQPQQIQCQNNVPEGTLWSDVSIVRVNDTVLFTAKDITSLKYVEGQLRQTNVELENRIAERAAQIQQLSTMQQAILKYAGLAITATDKWGVIQLVNPALEAISGYRADELVGNVTPAFIEQPTVFHAGTDLLNPERDSTLLAGTNLTGTDLTRTDLLQQENTIITKEGKRVPVLSITSGLYDEQFNLTGYVNFATDISYLKRIEKELIQANERIQLATTAGNLGVWEWNLQTSELTLDKNFYSLFGLPAETVMDRISDLAHLVYPDDYTYFIQNAQHIIQEGEPFDVQFKVIYPVDKSIHYMKADGMVLRDETGTGLRIVGIVRDRTAERESEYGVEGK